MRKIKRSVGKVLAAAVAVASVATTKALTNDYSTVVSVLDGSNNAFDTGFTTGIGYLGVGIIVGALFFGIASAFKKKPK